MMRRYNPSEEALTRPEPVDKTSDSDGNPKCLF
jgi:hypothetical protein